jgi:23S rRNA (uracil1939-C5)-methyltransferase
VADRVVIERLGHRGDGIAEFDGGIVYVPYALPSETVLIERRGARAELLEVERPSRDRAEPFCPYFRSCGGCITQHITVAAYANWKRAIVASALAQANLATTLEPLIDAHGAGRRRVTFHARHKDGKTQVGYMAARSHDVVEIVFCPIAEPQLKEAPRAARALADVLAGSRKPLDIQITATGTGLDIDIRGHGPLAGETRTAMVEAAAALDLARLSLHGETLVERRAPVVAMGRAQVVPPPGSFLQATRLGEEVLSSLVLDACQTARRVADLFTGCGPFALRLAQTRDVHAVDGDAVALASLNRAARSTSGLRRITVETRDLFRRPLLGPELQRYDAVVIDPPRAGAEGQMKQLAAAKVPLVVSISCDAGTFARDAAILVGAGYALERVVPVDQFKYSAHVEIVGVLRHPRVRAKKVPR